MTDSRTRRALAVFVVVLTGLVAGSSALDRVGHLPLAAPAPADAALALQTNLAYHSVLAADLMRSRIRGDEDLARAAEGAVARNTDAMRDLVGAVLGDQWAEEFRLLWSAHVTALSNYSSGVEDPGARDAARAALSTFEGDLAGFLATGSRGRLSREAARAAAYLHVDHLMRQADAYAARDYARADQLYREGYAHTFALGETIAAALLGPAGAEALREPGWRLRSQLARLLGEHVVLAVAATRAGVTNAPDFAAAGEAVNANTRDLAGAIDTLFGAAAAQGFQSLWADHVDQLMAYTGGVAAGDAGRREAAVNRLKAFEREFAAFLSTATAGRLPATALAGTLLTHDQMLMAQIDAYAGKQYEQAHDSAYSTYHHMGEVAGDLALAFSGTLGDRAPAGGSQTGYGGTAGHHGPR
ncbi:hypothetical protein [Asanoa siamensis]|uniref:Uncharacterized protein n=1 Tax=Asanoa siamensis TaxID=926357 RepID=A0ABQ4CNG2_9ACTN|nr:hypothetical protein [Asanoa siamensis]GIF72828.1 hypothetical protein Asi02nite_23460 [Asanoa siamensis]